jgi:acetyl-CoA synthetase
MYEGAPDFPAKDRFWAIIEKYKVNILYTAPDGDPRLHEVGRGSAEEARHLVAAAAGLGRRADQSRGVDVVSPRDRRRALPDRRHLVADRDRPHPDLAAARHHEDEARLGLHGVPGIEATS